MKTAVAVAVLTMLVAPAASAQTVPDIRPPDAYLSSSSGEVKGEVQMFCWSEPDGMGGTFTVCGDRFDDIDPAQSLVVRQGELVTLRFLPLLDPTSVGVSRVERSFGPSLQDLDVPDDNPTSFRADLPPGTHLLRVSAGWPQGSAVYMFKVTVVADQPGSGVFLPPELLDAVARITEAARALVGGGGSIDQLLAELLASTAALVASLEDLLT